MIFKKMNFNSGHDEANNKICVCKIGLFYLGIVYRVYFTHFYKSIKLRLSSSDIPSPFTLGV